MAYRPSNLVHTDEAAPIESAASAREDGSTEPRTRSSAVEHALHTGGVAGSIPAASTIPYDEDWPRVSKANYVYFVRAETLRLIKIGIAKDLDSRISGLQTASPDRLALMGIIRPSEDPKYLEARLHNKFSDHRAHGEWFHPDPSLEAYIAKHAISPAQNQYELAHQAMFRLSRGAIEPMKPWTADMEEMWANPVTAPDPASLAGSWRPTIPDGVEYPKGNDRKSRMTRYLLARGLAA